MERTIHLQYTVRKEIHLILTDECWLYQPGHDLRKSIMNKRLKSGRPLTFFLFLFIKRKKKKKTQSRMVHSSTFPEG